MLHFSIPLNFWALRTRIPCSSAFSYLIVVLGQFEHLFDDGLVQFAVFTVILQGQTLHPAFLMEVQQHLNTNKHDDCLVTTKTKDGKHV